jgi:hypothetical protein
LLNNDFNKIIGKIKWYLKPYILKILK